MSRIDFYVYKIAKNIETIACQLAVKAWQNKLSLYIYTNSTRQTKNIDNLLWNFRDDSFIPHAIIDNYNVKTLIHIGNQQNLPQPMTMLINLSDEVPLFFSQFLRVAEIIIPDNKIVGRKCYKFYQDRGYSLQIYNLDK